MTTAWGNRPSRTLREQRARPLKRVTPGRQLSRLTWIRRPVTRLRRSSRPSRQPSTFIIRTNLTPGGRALPTNRGEEGETLLSALRPSKAPRACRIMVLLPWVVLSLCSVLLTPIRVKRCVVPLTTLADLSPNVPLQRSPSVPHDLRWILITLRVRCNLQQSLVSSACRAVLARVWPLWVRLTTAPFTPAVRTCPFLVNNTYLVARLIAARPCGVKGKTRAPALTRLSTDDTTPLLGKTERMKLPVGLANRESGRPILTPLERRINVLADRRSGT